MEQITDYLVYFTIKYHLYLYKKSPSLTKLSQLIGCSIPTIRKSIKKLNGLYFQIIKSGRNQEYCLIKDDNISDYKFLTDPNITFEDKKHILATQLLYEKHFNGRSN